MGDLASTSSASRESSGAPWGGHVVGLLAGPGGSLLAVVLGLAAGVFAGTSAGIGKKPLMIVVAIVVGGLLTFAVATRYWFTLLVVLAIRTSLDAFKTNSLNAGGLEPGTAVGGVFLIASLLWLLGRRRSVGLVPLSRTARAALLFSAACVASSLSARLPGTSLVNSFKVVSVAVMIVVLEQLLAERPERVRPLLFAVSASLVVPALLGFYQLASGSQPADYQGISRIQGTFPHTNAFATYLGVVALLALALRPHLPRAQSRAATTVFAVSGMLLLFTYARGPWLAFMVGVLVIGILQDRRLVWALVAGVVVVVLAVPSVTTRFNDVAKTDAPGTGSPNSLSWRYGYWQRVLPMAKQGPVTGIGLGMVQESTVEGLPPHNGFVQAFVETGVFGLVALLVLVAMLWSDLRRALRSVQPGFARGVVVGAAAGLMSLLVQMFSENLLTQTTINWYLFVAVAFATTTVSRARTREGSPEDALHVMRTT